MKLQFRIVFILLLLLFSLPTYSQIKGIVTDSITDEPLMYISIHYTKDNESVSLSNANGAFVLDQHKNWDEISFSSVGYNTKIVKLKPGETFLKVKMSPNNVQLSEVVVKPKKEKYSRKNNPAVEFMRKVMKHKRAQSLEANDFYSYDKYEKMKTSINDITPEKMEKGIYKKYSFLRDQVEVSDVSKKLILPISVQETASQTVFRKKPESKKTIIKGMTNNGINEFFATGDAMNTVLQDVFTNINIYDNEIRLLQRRFTSPIAEEGIYFYKYYLLDTVVVDKDTCVHVTFVPQNSQDFGFTGNLYVLKDSTYAVKKCDMNLPKKTGVNFVNRLDIKQNYIQLPNGNWALKDDDMTVDLSFIKSTGGLEVQRSTKYNNYSFSPLEERLFRLKGSVIKEADMLSKSDEYWAQVRQTPLTRSESSMDLFIRQVEQIPGFKAVVFGMKALIENFVETSAPGKPNKFDIGPINTMITANYIDGLRLRFGGMTTAKLNPHLFLSGYGAYGFRDKRWKYSGTMTYSFNKRDYILWEFPKNSLSFTYSYDVMSPMDKFLFTDKDNVFLALKATTVDQMSYMRDATLNYDLETLQGFGIKAMLRRRNDEPCGNLHYYNNNDSENKMPLPGVSPIHDITTTEASLTFRYAPGESFVNSKQRRIPVSLDAPIFTLTHTIGIKGVLGGQYNFNRTEASFWKRIWMPSSWGKIDVSLKGGIEWNTVPFPFLILPEANLSYITQRETFCLINNMEFLNDRFASLSLSYDMNGKLLNRIPLIKKLKWREMFRVRTLWGTLSDKNNPFKSNNPDLFLFPMRDGQYTSHVMEKTVPYVEISAGIYNIFKLLHIEYVRRLSYLDNPGANKWGIRFMVLMIF